MNRWKENWAATQQHYLDWWNRDGLILGMWGHGFASGRASRDGSVEPPRPETLEAYHTDPDYVSQRVHYTMGTNDFPGDCLPIVRPSAGTMELAAHLGAGLSFSEDTIWYEAIIEDPASWPALSLDTSNKWYERVIRVMQLAVEKADGNYMVGLPGISPNLDVLAQMRGTGELMMDLYDRPDWVKQKLTEIDEIYFGVYDTMHEIVKLSDGSSSFYPFMLWAPGKVTQLQCDVSAMISADTFREFAVPGLKRATDRADRSLFHVDGPEMIKHVGALLEIESLDALQYTPGPGVPPGEDPHWHDMYKRILDGGKCVQIVVSNPSDIPALLDEIGTKGVYLFCGCTSTQEMESLCDTVEQRL